MRAPKWRGNPKKKHRHCNPLAAWQSGETNIVIKTMALQRLCYSAIIVERSFRY
jgi:hypothetical protein